MMSRPSRWRVWIRVQRFLCLLVFSSAAVHLAVASCTWYNFFFKSGGIKCIQGLIYNQHVAYEPHLKWHKICFDLAHAVLLFPHENRQMCVCCVCVCCVSGFWCCSKQLPVMRKTVKLQETWLSHELSSDKSSSHSVWMLESYLWFETGFNYITFDWTLNRLSNKRDYYWRSHELNEHTGFMYELKCYCSFYKPDNINSRVTVSFCYSTYLPPFQQQKQRL